MPGDLKLHSVGIFMLIISAAITVFDIYVYVRYGNEATISYTILEASVRNPIVPFAMGMLAGHLFWKQ
jgi:hypothetical protein